MISHSPTAKGISFALAVGIVAGAVTIGLPQEEIAIEGGGAPVEAMMGSSFEDMAVGTLTPEPAEPAETPVAEAPTAAEPLRPTTAEQTPPEQAEPVTPPEQAQPVTPPDVAAVTPAAPAAPAALAPTPLAVPPSESAQVAPPPETLQAQDPDSDAPVLSRRPMRKNPETAAKIAEARAKQEQAERERRQAEQQAAARGNAQRNATKGSSSGQSTSAKSTSTGKRQAAASAQGNAAASNYPGQVMRRISRAGKPRVRTTGTATIAFAIASNGGLASVSVARGSGSAALDRAAVSVIRKAAPFPRPPAGARRQYSIKIKGQ
ncbi:MULTISPECIES: energy transducer TonB [unclassified Sulfitobacter]|uniref:cell envelope integrity protein TolA n=1 Tax=Sulfitobacter TaxID=60136 RepID=UPI000320FE37|nr:MULTISPECIES: energy transducer TonB [unclassified Sulfitobacter]AXI50849.1 hypothetical protein C1J04_07960 [Sulfitobacter sp. SK025]